MSADNVQVLREGYAAFARQDVPAVMAMFDENIEWSTPESLPFGGNYSGHAGVGEFFGALASHWQELSVEPVEFIADGDTVVVLVHNRAVGAGGPLDMTSVHLWRMREGKGVSFTEYMDTARVLKALGQ